MRIGKSLQQLIAFVFGVVFTITLLTLAIFLPNPTEFQFIVFRIVLALAAAGVAAMIPGILEVRWSNWIKAGGALGVFVITYLYNPALPTLKDAEITLSIPEVIDFRTNLGHDFSEEQRLSDTAVVTAPFLYRNTKRLSKRIEIIREKIIVEFPNNKIDFSWKYFVNQNRENYGKWLGIEKNSRPFSIPAGENIDHETLFTPNKSISWHTFANLLRTVKEEYLSIKLIAQTENNQEISAECNADINFFQKELTEYEKNNDKHFMRATLPCINYQKTIILIR